MESGIERCLSSRIADYLLILLALLFEVIEIEIADLERSLADIDLPKYQLLVGHEMEAIRIEAKVGIQSADDEIVLAEYRYFLFL